VVSHFWKTQNSSLTFGSRPLVMGILNVTPDSFSDGGRFTDPEAAVARAQQMESEGADLIDIGGESTRPGAAPVSVEEECCRVLPILDRLLDRVRIPISIDTTKTEVARRALEAGAEIVNDVGGGEWDPGLLPLVAEKKAGYVLMHSRGRPGTMQDNPQYENVVEEVRAWLERRLTDCAKLGLPAENIVCDPGIGFGKTVEHNMALLAGLPRLAELGRPILVGVSRKSFLKRLGGEEHLALSNVVAQVWSSALGASIWRVHDVVEAAAAARLIQAFRTHTP
jgi:dihydropteroate synthase